MNTAIAPAQAPAPSFLQRLFGQSKSPAASSTPVAPTYQNDQVNLSQTQDPNQSVSFFTRVSDTFGNAFSNLAFSMRMGDTYEQLSNEFDALDLNKDGYQNIDGFTHPVYGTHVAEALDTYNPLLYNRLGGFENSANGDMTMNWLRHVDRNGDNRISRSEYIKARKAVIDEAFKSRDLNGDNHLNAAEVRNLGSVSYIPYRVVVDGSSSNQTGEIQIDRNRDGQISRRELTAAHVMFSGTEVSTTLNYDARYTWFNNDSIGRLSVRHLLARY